MGTKCQEAKNICNDFFLQDLLNKPLNPNITTNNINNTNGTNSFQNNTNNTTNNHLLTEVKPSPKFIESYNDCHIFFKKVSNIIKLQRTYRHYVYRKQLKSLKEHRLSHNNFHSLSKSATDESLKQQVNNEEPSELRIQKIPKTSCTSLFTYDSLQDDDVNDKKIKGYFLMKRCKFTFYGVIKNKKKDGFGKVIWNDDSVLYAKFILSKVEGYSRYKEKDETSFEGVYSNNRPCGYGIFQRKDEVSFEGNWEKNYMNGVGKAKWKDGTVYEGDFINTIKTGIGTFKWDDGTVYQGEFDNNKMTGYGIIYHSDKRIYAGQVVNGRMDGYGEFHWVDGTKYIGNYKMDKKCGFGMFYWNTNPLDAYIGFWDMGKQHGPGLQINGKTIAYGIWTKGRNDITFSLPSELLCYLRQEQKKYKTIFQWKVSRILSLLTDVNENGLYKE